MQCRIERGLGFSVQGLGCREVEFEVPTEVPREHCPTMQAPDKQTPFALEVLSDCMYAQRDRKSNREIDIDR